MRFPERALVGGSSISTSLKSIWVFVTGPVDKSRVRYIVSAYHTYKIWACILGMWPLSGCERFRAAYCSEIIENYSSRELLTIRTRCKRFGKRWWNSHSGRNRLILGMHCGAKVGNIERSWATKDTVREINTYIMLLVEFHGFRSRLNGLNNKYIWHHMWRD